jgi:hypothetical protein
LRIANRRAGIWLTALRDFERLDGGAFFERSDDRRLAGTVRPMLRIIKAAARGRAGLLNYPAEFDAANFDMLAT